MTCKECDGQLQLIQQINWLVDKNTGKVYNPNHTHWTRCTSCMEVTEPNIVIPVVTTYGG